jgi:hypothetical protein
MLMNDGMIEPLTILLGKAPGELVRVSKATPNITHLAPHPA